jgi:DNA-binding NtrC family response regulator/tetratricopeptide (TPR) repeat protein
MTYEHARQLFRKGRFLELTGAFKNPKNWDTYDVGVRLYAAQAFALTGDHNTARLAADVDKQRLSPSFNSQRESILGTITWRSGDSASSWKHVIAAAQLGAEAKDPERNAWASLQLLRVAIDSRPTDALAVMLPRARKAVIKAGIPSASAYLHLCVATIEGNRGNFDEAWRHCDIAEALLESDVNAWVLSGVLVNKGCIATVRCEFRAAAEYFHKVIALSEICGVTRNRTAARSNLGYLQLAMGQFREAEGTLRDLLSNSREPEQSVTAGDFLARVYLAQGDLVRCKETLDALNITAETFPYSQYGARWTALTRAKLLLKCGEFEHALQWLATIERRSVDQGDRPFNAALHLLTGDALHRVREPREASQRIVRADLSGITQCAELQGQFHHTIGSILRDTVPSVAKHFRERASRIWASQGIVSVQAEIDDARQNDIDTTLRRHDGEDVAVALNSAAAVFDVASKPRLLGAELLRILEAAHFSSKASVVDLPNAVDLPNTSSDVFEDGDHRLMLRLGDSHRLGKGVFLSSAAPATPADAVIVGDIFRLGRAAVALERARRDERKRAALWPSDPIEDDGDALFLAEEMQTVVSTARRVATANIPVLITGETGTGKEVLARLIHSYSPRAAKTFLPFNCTATPREMLDAQLFGHRKGAFTGATENFAGVIRAASGGTLFLDEIGESTLDIQPKLLRFLESGEVHPIGETHPQRVDVRVIAATNADVDALVAQGRFREDLFYRLNIVRLQIPPLRERRVEIPSFANHYLQKYAKEMNKGDLRLAEETMEYLVLYRWPGNVRQVANEMRRLAALAEPGAVLMPEHLSADIAASRRTVPVSERPLDKNEMVVRLDQPLTAALQHVDRVMVEAAVANTSSVDEAAKLLGLSRKGLYLKRLRYGMDIDRPKHASGVA